MSRQSLTFNNFEERIVFGVIVGTYALYITGTLYVVGALVGWALAFVIVLRWFVSGQLNESARVPVTVWVWILGMFMMLVALLVAHADFDMSMGQTIKSSIGWAKGWALLALFPLIGAIAKIRPEIIVRASCMLSSQAVLFVVLGLLLVVVGFQGPLYVSPLKAVGGPISTFEVNLYGLNPETGKPRWAFFAPWAPAAGLISCLLLITCRLEKDRFWRRMGMLGALVMCLFCQSRSGWAIFMALIPAFFLFKFMKSPALILLIGMFISSVVVLGQPLIEHAQQLHQDVKDSRPGSTRVREALASIAVQRWESEAPVWGHGIVEQGPKLVEYMPIGSHHSWYGLLFIKGIVGLLALAIPMLVTFIYLLCDSARSRASQTAFLMMVVFVGYSFFENLEILAYLYWPALVWIGMALNPLKSVAVDYPSSGVAV